MLSKSKQIYLAILVLIIVGVFFFPDVYRDAKTEHKFCCSSFNSKVVKIELDSNDNWLLELENNEIHSFDKFLKTEDVEDIAIGDSIVKEAGSLAMKLYNQNKLIKEINKENASMCECE